MSSISFLPTLDKYRKILHSEQGKGAHIETERAIVHGNRDWELIHLYEEKVKKVIEQVREG